MVYSDKYKPLANLTTKTGKAAVFIRGFLTYMTEQPVGHAISFRQSQQAGLDLVQSLGEDISVPYISNLSRVLVDRGIVSKQRVGRKFVVVRSDKFDLMCDFLEEHETWGTTIEAEDDVHTIEARSIVLNHIEYNGSLRLKSANRIPRKAWQVVWDKFQAGELDLIFIEPTSSAFSLALGDHKHKLIEPATFDNSSVAR